MLATTTPDATNIRVRFALPWLGDTLEGSSRTGFLRNSDPYTRNSAVEKYTCWVIEQDNINQVLEKQLRRTLDLFPNICSVALSNTFKSRSDAFQARFKYALRRNSISRKWIRKPQLLALFRAIAAYKTRIITRISTEGHWVKKKWARLDNSDFGDDSNLVGSIKYCISDFESAVCKQSWAST